MTRSLGEWVGSDSDAPVPPRVRLRVFEREEGRCYLSGRKIMPGERWQLDHKIALINGGQNRESNLAPVLVEPHREKTARDVAEKSKVARIRKKHLGIREPSKFAYGRDKRLKKKLNGQIVPR